MCAYQHISFTVLDRYDMLYGGHKSDAGVDSDIYMELDFLERCETCL
jgi:hypothetical protein